MRQLARIDVLVLDDWGLESDLTDRQRRDLLEILDDRYAAQATVVTSQRDGEHWHQAWGDPTLAEAILDRLVHHAYRVKLKGQSMRKNYLKVIARQAGPATHVLDRFHIMAPMSKAIDEVRAQAVRERKAHGAEPVLTKTRWRLLKRPERLNERQTSRLSELLRHNLKTVRSDLLKEEFQRFWDDWSPAWARAFLDEWCGKTLCSPLEPMKRVARMLRNHRELILNWFRAQGQLSSGVVEGFNTKAKLTTRKAFGFRTSHALQIALYHTLGALPEPEFTHRFI